MADIEHAGIMISPEVTGVTADAMAAMVHSKILGFRRESAPAAVA
ncbi:hypothetical protein [Desulfofundulus thermobenzoicus]|nr:hypothetical protein [Desulfofundulus thermobenzoicus]